MAKSKSGPQNLTNGAGRLADKKKKKRIFPLILALIIVIVVGGIAATLVLNLFNLREGYVMPYLRNAPLVGTSIARRFPPPEGMDEEEELGPYAGMSAEEIEILVTSLEADIERLRDDLRIAQDQQRNDADTINNLREITADIVEHRRQKDEFDEMIASGDPEAFATFYEGVNPEIAERIFQEAAQHRQFTSEERRISRTFAEMDESTAAEGLEHMLNTGDSEMVIRILVLMSVEDRASILNEMRPEIIAVVTRLMYPEEPGLPTAPPPAASLLPLLEPFDEAEDDA